MGEPRNVLVILCDQLRADFLSPYGGPEEVSPNLAHLAAEAAVFDKAYSVKPLCAPARMTMLTGMHPCTCPVPIPGSVPTVASMLSRAGYRTAALGKMHMQPPRGPYGFDELILSEDTGPGMFLDDFHRHCAEEGYVEWTHGLDNFDVLPVENPLPEDKTVTWWNAHQAERFLRERAGPSQPFYAVASFVKPHPPYDPPRPWSRLFSAADVPTPVGRDRGEQDYPELVRLYRQASGVEAIERLGLVERIRAHYLGLVAQIDDEIGRLLSALDEEGLAENTLVVFSADHGDMLGDHHLFMKFYPYEGSGRIPLILRGPGVSPGRWDRPVSQLDFVPTILQFCGLPIPPHCQGLSLFDVFGGDECHGRGVLIETAHARGFCLAGRDCKYTLWAGGEEELFNLSEDPYEEVDLAAERPPLRDRMRARLVDELHRLDAYRLPGMPPLLREGAPAVDPVDPRRFDRLRGRFLHHRLPPGPGRP